MSLTATASGNPVDAEGTVKHRLFGRFPFTTMRLPQVLARESEDRFEELWALHPAAFYEMRQPGTGATIAVPRWQQAYARDYRYSGNVNRALPVPSMLGPFLSWAQVAVDARL